MKTSMMQRWRLDLDGSALPVRTTRKILRNPGTAALLSIVPGLGQLYNGEVTKGILFLTASLVNYGVILSLLLAKWAFIKNITLGTDGQSSSLQQLGTILQYDNRLLLGYSVLVLSFIVYAARDAYNHALLAKKGLIFPRHYLGMPELTCSSYLAHLVLMISCFVVALCFVMPRLPSEQATNIEFVQNEPKQAKAPEKPKRLKRAMPTATKTIVKHTVPKTQKARPPIPIPTPKAVAALAPIETPDLAPAPTSSSETVATGGGGTSTKDGTGDAGSGGTQEIDFGPYLAELQRRIKRAWFPPKGNESKRVVVAFKIYRNGSISPVKLVKSSGLLLADDAAINAVEKAAPFAPLPKGAPEEIDLRFTLDYSIFGADAQPTS